MAPAVAGVLGKQRPEDAFLLPSPFMQTLLLRIMPAMSSMDNPAVALGPSRVSLPLARLIAEAPGGMSRTPQTGTTAGHDPVATMTDGFAGFAYTRFDSSALSLQDAHARLIASRTALNDQSKQMPPGSLRAMPSSADFESHSRYSTRIISLGGGRPFSSFGVDLADIPGQNRVHNHIVLPATAARALSRRSVLLLAAFAADSMEGKASVAQRIVQTVRMVASNRSLRSMRHKATGSANGKS